MMGQKPMEILVSVAPEFLAESRYFLVVRAVHGVDLHVRDGACSASMSAADVAAADQTNVDRHLFRTLPPFAAAFSFPPSSAAWIPPARRRHANVSPG